MKIKNWEGFQHYKTGKNAAKRPEWIKLYTRLLDDIEFHQLSGNDAKVLMMLWMLASENGGALPPVKTIAFRLRLSEKEINSVLARLPHWIESPSYDIPRTEEEEKENKNKKEKERESRAIALPPAWRPSESHFSQAKELGFSPATVEDMAEDMRCWAGGKGVSRKDWDLTFSGWMRREQARGPRRRPVSKSEEFRRDVGAFLQEVDSNVVEFGTSRRAICGPSGGSSPGELHAAAAGPSDHVAVTQGNAGRRTEGDFAEDG